jgi:HK97 family phage portal protein
MSFLARLNPFAKKSSITTLELFRDVFGGIPSKTGVSVTWETALQCTAALGCARVIAEGVAQLPIGVYRDEGRRRIEMRKTDLARLLATGPNPYITTFEFVETLLINAVLGRGGYALIQRSPIDGGIIELLSVPSAWVTEKRDAAWRPYFEVEMRVSTDGPSQRLRVPSENMLRVRGPSLDGYVGLSGLKLAREAIGLSLAMEESHARLHKNGVQTTGAWSLDGNLEAEQHKRLVAMLEKYQGLENNGRPLVLDRAAKWQQMQMKGVDAQHLETRKFQIEEVCRALRVFPIMVGHADKTATYASAEQMFLAHVVHTLMPWIRRIEQAFARDLLTDAERTSGAYVKLSVQGLMRGDAKTRAEFYQKGVLSGWMTRNEVRALEEMDAIDGLDEPLTPSNMLGSDMQGHNGGPALDDVPQE